MIIYRCLDEVFRTWSNVAVMRALIDTNTGFTGNEVARVSGMHPRSAIIALTSLENLGLVNRQRGGRDHIFTLNREHFLFEEVIEKAFNAESRLFNEIIKQLEYILKKRVYSAVIFGSTARKEETPQSDMDICCIVNSPLDIIFVGDTLNKESETLFKKYGIKLAPVLFLKTSFMKKRRTKVIREIIDDGILITGKHPRDLIGGK